MPQKYITGSLGHSIESLRGGAEPSGSIMSKHDSWTNLISPLEVDDYAQAFANWNHLVELLHDPANECDGILSSLQRNIFDLILEWLKGQRGTHIRVEDVSWRYLAEDDISLFIPKDDLMQKILDSLPPESKILISSSDSGRTHDPSALDYPGQVPDYDRTLKDLFRLEFRHCGADVINGINYGRILTENRENSAYKACCQRIGLAWLESKLPSFRDVNVDSGRLETTLVSTRRPFAGTSFHHQGRHTDSNDATLTLLHGHIGANIDPCPWLSDEAGLPYYLWSIELSQVVETSKIERTSYYTAISHTWGRWQKPGPPVRVDGVHGWLIPENSIFDVKTLPDIMRKVPVATPYIWFDLLCIPQDRSDIAMREIARQAVIFRNAQYAIAWLNMCEDWRGLKATTEWMCMHYLSSSALGDRSRWARSFEAETFRAAGETTALNDHYDNYGPNVSESDLRPSAWFTSLWTLQEVCLRPDMLLCSKHWDMLTIGNGQPVSLDGLAMLSSHIIDHASCTSILMGPQAAASHRFDPVALEIDPNERLAALIRGGQYPRGYLELFILLEKTGLEDLHIINRESILKLGSQRHCKEGRAEAIMSVIGSTHWFIEAFEKGTLRKTENELVLDLYPLSFLKETAQVVGAHFFHSIHIRNRKDNDMLEEPLCRGSLLPFSPNTPSSEQVAMKIFLPRWHRKEADHPSVKSWKIAADGSVEIFQAAILAPYSLRNRQPIHATITLAYAINTAFHKGPGSTGLLGDRSQTVDLRSWEQNWLRPTTNYAVALMNCWFLEEVYVQGVLLKEISPGILMKVGIFVTQGFSVQQGALSTVFQDTIVNWRVI